MKNRAELLWFVGIAALPFIWPVYFWPLVLLSYSPFFFITLKSKRPFFQITAWFTSFMIAHTLTLFLSLSSEEGSFFLLLCLFLICFFIALHAAVWFYLVSRIAHFFSYFFIKIILLCMALFIFFLFFDRALFWFFGAFQGYTLLHPLLPLSCFSPCIKHIAFWGESFSLIFLIVCNMLFSFLYQESKEKYRSAALCLLILGVFSSFFPLEKQEEKNPLWLSRIAWTQITKTTQTAYDTAQEIKSLVVDIIKQQPEVQIIVFPESTFCYSLCDCPASLALLSGVLTENKKIIFGAHEKVEQKLFSCFFIVDHNGIFYCYKKKKLLFFAEELPSFFPYFSYFKQLFLGSTPAFYPADKKQKETITLFDGLIFTPYICSELFLGHKKNNNAHGIIALVNDKRFSYGPFCDLLCKTAFLKALLWGQPILYIGYRHQAYIPSY